MIWTPLCFVIDFQKSFFSLDFFEQIQIKIIKEINNLSSICSLLPKGNAMNSFSLPLIEVTGQPPFFEDVAWQVIKVGNDKWILMQKEKIAFCSIIISLTAHSGCFEVGMNIAPEFELHFFPILQFQAIERETSTHL